MRTWRVCLRQCCNRVHAYRVQAKDQVLSNESKIKTKSSASKSESEFFWILLSQFNFLNMTKITNSWIVHGYINKLPPISLKMSASCLSTLWNVKLLRYDVRNVNSIGWMNGDQWHFDLKETSEVVQTILFSEYPRADKTFGTIFMKIGATLVFNPVQFKYLPLTFEVT